MLWSQMHEVMHQKPLKEHKKFSFDGKSSAGIRKLGRIINIESNLSIPSVNKGTQKALIGNISFTHSKDGHFSETEF